MLSLPAYRGTVDESAARQLFAQGRVARLATLTPTGRPHVVPVAFAVAADIVWTAVDGKPKSGRPLQRLANMAAHPQVSVLVDHYDDDWARLWWVRADGSAQVVAAPAEEGRTALAEKYPQYRETALPGPFIRIAVERWRFWSAR